MDARHLAVMVEVDRERELRIDFNTLCEAERHGNLSFLTDMNLPLSFVGMRAICFASWVKDDPKLTLEGTGIILQDHWHKVMGALMEAWSEAMATAEEGDPSGSDPTETTTTQPS